MALAPGVVFERDWDEQRVIVARRTGLRRGDPASARYVSFTYKPEHLDDVLLPELARAAERVLA